MVCCFSSGARAAAGCRCTVLHATKLGRRCRGWLQDVYGSVGIALMGITFMPKKERRVLGCHQKNILLSGVYAWRNFCQTYICRISIHQLACNLSLLFRHISLSLLRPFLSICYDPVLSLTVILQSLFSSLNYSNYRKVSSLNLSSPMFSDVLRSLICCEFHISRHLSRDN